MSRPDTRQELREWIARTNGRVSADEIEDETPLITRGLLKSLHVLDLILWIEERRERAIDPERIRPGSFASIEAIHEYRLALLDAPSAPHTANARDLSSERGARAARLALYADYWLGRLRPGNPCLRRSLALFWRLRRAGLPVAFCLGVRSDQALAADEPAAGHAWLELDGVAILESEATVAHYATTFRYPLDRGS